MKKLGTCGSCVNVSISSSASSPRHSEASIASDSEVLYGAVQYGAMSGEEKDASEGQVEHEGDDQEENNPGLPFDNDEQTGDDGGAKIEEHDGEAAASEGKDDDGEDDGMLREPEHGSRIAEEDRGVQDVGALHHLRRRRRGAGCLGGGSRCGHQCSNPGSAGAPGLI